MILGILQPFRDFCDSWGNVASVLGLLVSLFGFWFAIRGITSAKRAAQQAEAAAKQAKDKVLSQGTLAHFSSAIAVMEETIRLQRKKEWGNALDRHSELRRLLVELKDGWSGITPERQHRPTEAGMRNRSGCYVLNGSDGGSGLARSEFVPRNNQRPRLQPQRVLS